MKWTLALCWISLLLSSCGRVELGPNRLVLHRQHLKELSAQYCERDLQHLDLSRNRLSDLPPCLADLHQLKTADLKRNAFVEIPEVIYTWEALEELSLAQNPLSKLDQRILRLKNLRKLDLWGSGLDELPRFVAELPNLEELDVRNTYLSTADVAWLSTLRPKLKVLSTYSCNCAQ